MSGPPIPRRKRGRPVKETPDRREEVLRTAARLFGERGFRNTTLGDVGAALGISSPALYHYARSKEELLSECANIAFDRLLLALEAAKASATGLDRVEHFFDAYAQLTWDDFGRCFVLIDLRELNEPAKELARQTQLRLGGAVAAFIAEGVEDGSIRPCAPADVSRALFAAFNGIPRWHHPGSSRSIRNITESFLRIFLQGIKQPV
jgi:AcrR family transcriptional regulator